LKTTKSKIIGKRMKCKDGSFANRESRGCGTDKPKENKKQRTRKKDT
jgi:hypothetical protein